MAFITQNAWNKALTKVIDMMIDKHIELGMKATGAWIDSLEGVQESETRGVIRGNDYTEYLANGREPGSMPPVSALEVWVNAKFGLSGKEANSAAWAVATKIKERGTTWYHQGGSDLVSFLHSDEVTDAVFAELAAVAAITVTDFITNEFERIGV